VYHHLLTPRSTGFVAVVNALRPAVDAIYDFTFAYEAGLKPTFFSAIAGSFPKRVHVHVRRLPIKAVPTDEGELRQMLLDRFAFKDALIDGFLAEQRFPGDPVVPAYGPADWSPPLILYAYFAFWVVVNSICVYGLFVSLNFRLLMGGLLTFFTLLQYFPPLKRLLGLNPPLQFSPNKTL